MAKKGVTEPQIQIAILELMVDRRVWSNADLKKSLASMLTLSEHDRERSEERENEARWENRVNNALSPSRPKSLSSDGLVEKVGHGLYRITDAGFELANSD